MTSYTDNNNDQGQRSFLEHIDRKLTAILANQVVLVSVPKQLQAINGQLRKIKYELVDIKTRLGNVESDVTFIKQVVSANSADIDDHEIRLKRLEKIIV